MNPCPCGTGRPLAACCGRHLDGEPAPTPEALMRSRYTAFVLGDVAHLRRTWDPATRPRRLTLDPMTVWTGLDVLATTSDADAGTVTFRAHHDGGVLAERSRFTCTGGVWRYVDGVLS